MNAPHPKPQHRTYLAHKKQAIWQIILPVVIAGLLMVGALILLYLGVTRGGTDLSRWAEISTIWLTIPVGVGAFIMLGVLSAVVYGLGRALGIIPVYTVIVQRYAWTMADGAKEVDRVGHKPWLIIPWIAAGVRWVRQRQAEARRRHQAVIDAGKG